MTEKILIIEDEEELVRGLKINLEAEGYDILWALDGESGVAKALQDAPDLILLDIMLPKKDGLEVCRELRRQDVAVPIVMLTAKSEEVDKVVGLEIGADDYVIKPFGVRELLARIRVQLRRHKREARSVPAVFRFDDVEIDFSHFKVRRRGREFDLTSLEEEILKYFVAHRGEVVSREALLDRIWGYEKYPTTRTVDNHILKLRKKIGEGPTGAGYIYSVYGEGYRFMGGA
jgi:DNA-binding response OmpR family regulator